MKTPILALIATAMFTAASIQTPHAAEHAAHGGASAKNTATAAQAPAGESVYTRYIEIQTALAADSMEGVADAAHAIARAIRAGSAEGVPPAVADQAEAVAKAEDLSAAREAFKLLSGSLIESLPSHGEKSRYHVVHCPMAKASWLQDTKAIANPYFGKSMLSCGTISVTSGN